MDKREREINALIARAGLHCKQIVKGGSGHYRATVETPSGEVDTTFACTPGDRRGDLNKLSALRRIAKGIHGRIG